MTHNQVAYFEAKTKEAANLESARHNRAQERLTAQQNETARRYNELQAYNTRLSLQEQARHNQATEWLTAQQIEAQRIYNEGQLRIASDNLLVTAYSADVKARDVEYQNAYRTGSLDETKRHNEWSEAETRRHNQTEEKTAKWRNLLTFGGALIGSTLGAATSLVSTAGHVIGTGLSTAGNLASTALKGTFSLLTSKTFMAND